MKEVNIYNVIISSDSLNSTYNKNFATANLDDCVKKVKNYIETLKTRQFASDYQIVKLRWTGTIIVDFA